MGQVSGKVAFITGAASGIGAACARVLAREGARVVITDLDDARGEQLAAGIRADGGQATYLHQDVTDEAAWPGIIAAIEAAHGRLDIAVANAGIGISLGDDCVVEAGCYVTAGSRVRWIDGSVVKARELSGRPGLLFWRNSQTGALEAVVREKVWGKLNPELHTIA